MNTDRFSITCECGLATEHPKEGIVFSCRKCQKPSVIDWSMGYTEQQLRAILDGLDVQRDAVVKSIETERQMIHRVA